jgi:antitoxin (DNA-binding transcriptional repressor) of toxin-antitoxin stability system
LQEGVAVTTTTVAAEPVTARTLSKRAGMIRRAAEAGEVIPVTFHGRAMAHVVPDDHWQQVQADLEHALQEAARLRATLAAHGIALEEAAVA